MVPGNSSVACTHIVASAADVGDIRESRGRTDIRLMERVVKFALKPGIRTQVTHARHASMSHALRLPPELIAEIFLQCSNEVEMRSIICQVCRAWRQVAISTPRLWSDITIFLEEKRLGDQMSLLRTWCERSGALPLTIALHGSSARPTFEHNPVITLIPYVRRIRNLHFSVNGLHLLTFCALPDGSLQSLETLHLAGFRNTRIPSPATAITVFQSAPRLREVCFFSINLDPYILRLPSQLTLLHSDRILTPLQFLTTLRTCSYLEDVSACLGPPSPTDILPNDITSLPCLLSLGLTIEEEYSGDTFFDHVTLPMLDRLKLTYKVTVEPWPQSSFLSLVSRSSFNLRALTLEWAEMSETQLLECLRKLPSLVELHIEFESFPCDTILDALRFVTDADQNLLPRLEHFKLDVSYGDFDESFVSMVESRWWLSTKDAPGVTRLRCAHGSVRESWINMDEPIASRLRKLREEGLIVSLKMY